MKMNRFSILLIIGGFLGIITASSTKKLLKTQAAEEYPFLENFKKEYNPKIGDCWLTTDQQNPENYQIQIYTDTGWHQLYVRDDGDLIYRHCK